MTRHRWMNVDMRHSILLVCALISGLLAAGMAQAAAYPPDTKLRRIRQPAMVRPGYLAPVPQPEFGTQITRIADGAAFGVPKAPVLRHVYAKNQAFNADETLVMLDYTYPAAILDGATFKFLRFIHQPSRAVWSNLDPNTTIGTYAGTNKLVAADMRVDGKTTVIHAFTEYRRIDFGLGEGNLSVDDRYAALFGVRPDNGVDLFVYDFTADAVVSRLDLGSNTIVGAHPTINNATMSPSGAYVVVQYNRRGLGVSSGIVAYDRALTRPVPLAPNDGSHYDVCTARSGQEVIAVQAPTSQALVSVALSDATTIQLLPASLMNYSIHISCRNTKRAGWAYISEFAGTPPQTGSADYQSVFALALDGSGTAQRFAHEHHSASTDYAHEPQAVPNHAGDRVVFASDWEGNGPVYDYVARAPR